MRDIDKLLAEREILCDILTNKDLSQHTRTILSDVLAVLEYRIATMAKPSAYSNVVSIDSVRKKVSLSKQTVS